MKYRQQIINRVTWIGACLDGGLALVKVGVGWFVHSPALIADGFHSLSDMLTDIAVVLFSHLGQLAPDDDHPYGHQRYETVGTVILGVSLLAVASFIAWGSIQSLIESIRIPTPSSLAVAIALLSIISKEWIFRYTMQAARRVQSPLMEANAWHSRSDAFSSVIVLIGVLATWLGYAWIELFVAIGVALLIGKMGLQLTWDAIQDLVDRGVALEKSKAIDKTIRSVAGVVGAHMLRSRKMASHIYLDVHIQVDEFISVSEGHFIAERVIRQVKLKHTKVRDITVHVDHENDLEESIACFNELPDRQAINALLSEKEIFPDRLQIHYLNKQVVLELYFSATAKNKDDIEKVLVRIKEKNNWLKEYHLFSNL